MTPTSVKIDITIAITSDKNITDEQQKAINTEYQQHVAELTAFIKDLLSTRDPMVAYEDAMNII